MDSPKSSVLSHLKPKQSNKKKGHLRFSDQLKNLKTNIFRSVDKTVVMSPGLYADGVQSYFQDSFEKHLASNYTEDFHVFASEVRPLINSLPLLLFHKEDIWKILIHHIQKPDSLAVDSLLDLLSALARDLLTEFYPFFRKTLEIVVGLIDLRNANRLEKCFNCIGYLFKFLRKLIVKDIHSLFFEYYYTILSHHKEYIRQFSAESFAFLLRNMKNEDVESFVSDVFIFLNDLSNPNDDNENLGRKKVNILLFSDGLINVFYETIKGVDKRFHSKLSTFLAALFRQFAKHSSSWTFTVLFGLVKKLCQHTDKDNSKELMFVIIKFTNHLISKVPESGYKDIKLPAKRKHALSDKTSDKLLLNLQKILEILHYCTTYRRGNYWIGTKELESSVFEIHHSLLNIISWHDFTLLNVILSLISSSMLSLNDSDSESLIENELSKSLKILFNQNTLQDVNNIKSLTFFIRELMKLRTVFGRVVLPHIIQLCNDYISNYPDLLIHLFLDIVDSNEWNRAVAPTIVRISSQNRFCFSKESIENAKFFEYLFNIHNSIFNEESEHPLYILWSIYRIWQYIELPYEKMESVLQKSLNEVEERMLDPIFRTDEYFLVLSEAFRCCWKLDRTYNTKKLVNWWNIGWKLIELNPGNVHILESILDLLITIENTPSTLIKKTSLQKLRTEERLNEMINTLQYNLATCNQALRVVTYKLLIFFENKPNSLLVKFLEIEEINKQSLEARAATHLLSDMEGLLRSLKSNMVSLITHCILGTLHIKYSPIWPISIKNLGIIADNHFDRLIEILLVFFEKIHDVLILQSNQVSGFKIRSRHILGSKKHKPAGFGITAQDPSTIKTSLEDDINSYSDDALETCFNNETERQEKRLGFTRLSTDLVTLHTSLWKSFALFPLKIEKVSKRIVPFFLNFIQKQYSQIEWRSLTPPGLFKDFVFLAKSEFGENNSKLLPSTQSQTILLDYLNTFALFKNPKTLKYSDIILQILEILLSYGNSVVQKNALQCLFPWKQEYINPYRESLERLVDDKTTREEMTSFNITIEAEIIKPQHRIGLSRIIIYILHSKLIAVNRRSKIHRHTILSYLGGFEISELQPLFDLILQPFRKYFILLNTSKESIYSALDSSSSIYRCIQKVSLSRKSKVLVLLQEVLKQFGKRIEMYLPQLLNTLVGMLLWESIQSNTSKGNIKNACLRRISTIVQLYPNFDYSEYFKVEFYNLMKPILEIVIASPRQSTPVLDLIVSMSSSPQLILSLHNAECISQVLECISTKASHGVLSLVLTVIDNLVDVETMIKERDLGIELLSIYVDTIIDKLNTLQLSASSQSNLVERVLQLLTKLAQYATDADKAENLLTALLVYLSPSYSYISIDRKNTLFQIIDALQHLIIAPECMIEPLAYQFLSISDAETKENIIVILNKLTDRLKGFDLITSILADINSFSKSIVGQYDFDKRLEGFTKLKQHCNNCIEGKDKPLKPLFYYPFVYCCLFFLKDNDVSIRGYAEDSLQNILKLISIQNEQLTKRINNDSGSKMKLQTKLSQFLRILTHMIHPWIKKIIRKSNRDTKRLSEGLKLLHHCIILFPNEYSDLQELVTDQWSFFLQFSSSLHQERVKAIIQLKRLVSPNRPNIPFSYTSLSQILIPLLLNQILSLKPNGNVTEESIQTIANFASHLPWNRYYRQLSSFISLADNVTVVQQKQIIRLSCSVLDAFHFLKNEDDMEMENQDEEENEEDDEEMSDNEDKKNDDNNEELENEVIDEDEDLEKLSEQIDDNEESKEKSKTLEKKSKKEVKEIEDEYVIHEPINEQEKKIIRTLTSQVIPNLIKHIKTDKSMISTNIHISLAIVKVIQLLPDSLKKREIPKLFKKIVSNLRSRDQSIRDDTRQTLFKVLEAVGSEYFGLVLRELTTILTKGYQLHILGFTIHFLLYNLQQLGSIKLNSLNHCVKSLSITLLDDIIGEAGQKKQVQQIRNQMKETKVTKSYETFTIVAKSIGFAEHIQDLIHPVYSVLISSVSSSTVKEMVMILQKISIGLSKNEGISYDQLLVFLHTIINDNIQYFHNLEEKEMSEVGFSKNEKEYLVKPKTSFEILQIQQGPRAMKEKRQAESDKSINLHVLAEFALSLFFSCLKRNKFDMKDNEQVSMLNPFIPLLVNALDSLHEKSRILSLKCMNLLVKAPLPALEEYLPIFNEKVFDIIKHSSSKSEIMPVCFKSLIILLRDCAPAPGRLYSITLDDEEIKYLISLASTDLDSLERSSLTFSLLKAIIGQKMILPELYDLMNRISELIVSASSPSVRQTCLQMFLNFLLYYPLGSVRLQQHLDFILKNLSYYSPDGRQSVLELLHQIVQKFPSEQVNEQAEYFYFSLVLCLVNDENATCREMAGNVIKLLLDIVDDTRYQSMFSLTKKWLSDTSNLALQRVAAQLIGFFIESVDNNIQGKLGDIIGLIIEYLEDDDEEDDDDDDTILYGGSIGEKAQIWHVLYYLLLSLEKLLRKNMNLLKSSGHTMDIYWKITILLLHSHSWVRLLSGRLFGLFFASLKNPKDLSSVKKEPFYKFLSQSGIAWTLCRRFCFQLKNALLTNDDGSQIIRNLLFLAVALYYDSNLHSNAILPLSKEHSKLLHLRTQDKDEIEDNNESENHQVVHWIFRYLSFMFRRVFNQSASSTSILKFFAGMAVQLPKEDFETFLIPVVSPIYHATNSQLHKEEITNLAEEVGEIIKEKVGMESYLKAYQTVRKNAEISKLKRKQERKMDMVANPRKAIKEREKQRQKSKFAKKRKLLARKPDRIFSSK